MRWLGGFLISLVVTTSQAQTFVQKSANQSLSAVATLTTTFTAVGSGHLVVGSAIWTPNTSSCTTNPTENVKDNNSVAVTVIDTIADTTNDLCLQTFYLPNVTNGATGLTLTLGSAVAQVGLAMQEWSGIATSSPLAQHIANIPTAGATVTSTAITTTASGDLIYGAFGNDNNGNNITSVGGSFTLRNNETSVNLADESQVQSSAGSISSTFTSSAGSFGGPIAVAAFLAATGGGASCGARALMGVGC